MLQNNFVMILKHTHKWIQIIDSGFRDSDIPRVYLVCLTRIN